MRNGRAVGVADHVEVKDDAAQARERGAAGLERILRALPRPLGAALQGLGDLAFARFVEAAVGVVAVGHEDAGELPRRAGSVSDRRTLRTVKIAADAVAGQ